MQYEIYSKEKIRVFFQEFPFLKWHIDQHLVSSVNVSRISEELLDFNPSYTEEVLNGSVAITMLSLGTCWPEYPEKEVRWYPAFLLDKEGEVLAQIGKTGGFFDSLWSELSGDEWSAYHIETLAETVERIGEKSKEVTYLVVLINGALTVYKNNKNLDLPALVKNRRVKIEVQAYRDLRGEIEEFGREGEKVYKVHK